jgi:hypothetical protein
MRPRPATLVRLTIAVAMGFSYPFLELAWKCRVTQASSEACVWGRAYLPFTRWVEPLIVAPLVFFVLVLVERYAFRRGQTE